MKLSRLIVLFAVSLALGLYIYYGIQKPAEEKEENGDLEARLIQSEPDMATYFSIQTLGSQFELKKENKIWKLYSSKHKNGVLADVLKVENLISKLKKIEQVKAIYSKKEIEQKKIDLNQFGISETSITLRYKTEKMEEDQSLQFGNKSPSQSGTYVFDSQSGSLLLVNEGLEYLENFQEEDFQEMRLVAISSSDIEEIKIQNAGAKYSFALDQDGQWKMKSPESLPVDSDKLRTALSKIGLLRANKFLDNKPKALNKPDISIILGFKEGKRSARSDENDPRPQGAQLDFAKSLKAGKDSKDPDHFQYLAFADKAGAAEISRHYYDSFNKSYRDYVIHKFEFIDVDDLEKVSYKTSDKLIWEAKYNGSEWQWAEPSDNKKPLLSENFLTAIQQFKSFRADTFVRSIAKEKLPSALQTIHLVSKEGKEIEYSFLYQSNESKFFWPYEGKFLEYSFDKKLFEPKLLKVDSLTTPSQSKISSTKEESQKD